MDTPSTSLRLTWWTCMVSLLIVSACHRQAASSQGAGSAEMTERASVDPSPVLEEMGMVEGPQATRILARVVERELNPAYDGSDHPCASIPCLATTEVLAILVHGMDFHGQFEEGELIRAQFDRTLWPSDSLYPSIQPALPGLEEGDVFEADIFMDQSDALPPNYRVNLYQKSN